MGARARRLFSALAGAAAAAIALAGCASPHAHRLTDFKYPPKPKKAEMEAFFGEVSRPYEKVAIIQSSPSDKRDSQTKAKQLDELRHIARRLGADAIQQVRLLSSSGNGLVSDPAPPFPSIKQGRYEAFFLRGEAIKFVDPSVDQAEPRDRRFSISETEERPAPK